MTDKIRRTLAAALAILCLLCAAGSLAEGEGTKVSYRRITIDGMTYLLSSTGAFYEPSAIRVQARSLYKALENHPEVKSYVYLVNSSRTVDVQKDVTAVPQTYTAIQKWFTDSETDYLRLNSLEDYARYFYTTDHHWNYQGSYAGYRQLVRMMLGEDEPVLEPVETVEFPVKFNGSMNKSLNLTDSQENFTVYRFDYPEMKLEINGRKKASYGNQAAYFAGKYSTMPLANHYSSFYGGEEGLIHLETDRTDRPNLVMISNSQSNALNLLLASHFHHTYIIDPRHYEDNMDQKFRLDQAVEEWDLDMVLILGDGLYFKQNYRYR